MRLIKRETKRVAVLSVVFGFLLLVGIFCAFFLTSVTMKKMYEKALTTEKLHVLALEREKKEITRQVYIALEEIKAGEKVTEEKVVKTEAVSEMDTSLYMTEDGLGKTSRIDIAPGTFITEVMLYVAEEEGVFSEVGYRDIKIHGNISVGDFVDIRICYPNGEDLRVLAAKRVEGIESASVIYLRLIEEEILMMASAVNDKNYLGAELYTAKCCSFEEGKNRVNYLPSEQVLELIAEYAETFLEQKAEYAEKRRMLEKRVLGG